MKSNFNFSLVFILLTTILNFSHSQVVINELNVAPANGDGSFVGYGPAISPGQPPQPGCGEWIELYNKSCVPVDISGYFLGTYNDIDGLGASFMVPSGKIIPAMGFAVIRGKNATAPPSTTIDIIADNVSSSNFCLEDNTKNNRMWFQNSGSWVGLYDKNGNVIDMIQWSSNDPTFGVTPNSFSLDGSPCVPSGSSVTSLQSFTGYGSGTTFTITSSSIDKGQTIVRIPDGGTFSTTTSTETFSYGKSNKPITAKITYSSPICKSSAIQSPTLVGTSGGKYSSTTGLTIDATNGNITPSSSTPGTYKIKYTLAGLACPGYDSTNVTIVNPTATASKTDPTCTGVTANSDGTITITATGGTSPYSYSKDGGTSYGSSATFTGLASNTYTLKAKDNNGCIASVSPNITLAVVCNCTAPIITTQPSSTTVCVNSNANFSVTANATATSYQWQVNTGSGWNNLVNQTSATLTLTTVTASMNAYQYQCIVKETTGNCPVTTNVVTLTVDNISATATSTNPTCNGSIPNSDGTITITSSNGLAPYTYSTDNGANFTNSNSASGLASNSYTVKAKDANGCIATVSPVITLSVTCPADPCVSPIITNQPVASKVCENTNATFTVVANATATGYQWQVKNGTAWVNINGQTTATLSLNNVTNSMNNNQYHCTILETTGKCPINSQDVTLTVDPTPVSSAGGSKTICSTSTATVSGATASSGTTYSWTENGNGTITVGANTLTPTYTPSNADIGNPVTLTMATVSGNTCPNPADVTFTINVDPLPTAVSTGTTTICSNATATVSGASHSYGNVLWSISGTGNGTITNQTTDSPTYTPNASDAGKTVTLSMHVTSTNTCPDPTVVTFKVTVDSLPLAKITGSKTICSSNSATITTAKSAYGDIAWTSDGTGTITNGSTLSPTYTPTVNDEGKTVTLTLTVTSNNSCGNTTKATANYMLNVIGAVVPTASTNNGSSTICMEKQVTISGASSSNGTVKWTVTSGNGMLTNETTLTPTYISKANDTLTPVKLTLTVNPPAGCGGIPASDIYTITVKSNPIVQPSCNKPCEGLDVQLNANTIPNAQYAWTGPKALSKSTQNVLLTKITASDTGQYNLQITDAFNCVNSKSIHVTMYPNPIIAGDTFVCVDKTINLVANTTGNTTSWSSLNPTNLTIDPITGIAIGELGGTATVKYTDINGCVDNQLILIENLPVVAFTVDSTSVCIGNDVKFTDKSINKNTNIIWDFGDGMQSNEIEPSYTYHAVDSFTVTLTSISPSGCVGKLTKEKYITPIEVPTIKFSFTPDSIDIYNPEIQFINYSNAKFYTWNFGDYSPIINNTSPSHTFPNTPGEYYKVTLKGSNSATGVCPVSVTQEIVSIDPPIFFIPNTFTPNEDELNNTFQPIFTSGYDPQNFSFWIYNRLGELIFETHNANIGWDGTYVNKIAENNTYIWKLQFKSKQTEKEYYKTGHVNLVK